MLSSLAEKTKVPKVPLLTPIIDILAIIGWGSLLLRYWLTGQLKLLIHPNYFILVFLTSLVLLALGITKIWFLLKEIKGNAPENSDNIQHITVLPRNWGSGLLLFTALLGLFVEPTVLTSQMALQRGVNDTLPVTRVETQSFRANIKPEDRTLLDWIRTLNAYPEPDAYTNQPVKLTGFVIHKDHLPENYLIISRFVLTCCAVDAYSIGLPVKLDQPRDFYPPDTWLEIEGNMITETLNGKRQLVIQAKTAKTIPTPDDPYSYRD
ncbi:MAG: TIGR03943 family protein [Microcystaceae cyanobacterium]